MAAANDLSKTAYNNVVQSERDTWAWQHQKVSRKQLTMSLLQKYNAG